MSDPFIGQIMIFGGNFAPKNWAFCRGQILSIRQNAALFALLGTIYGGNGSSTFALPDLRGRVAIGFGQGPGLSNYVLGQQSGTEAVTLNVSQMPVHNHSVQANNSMAGEIASPGNAFLPQARTAGITPTSVAAYAASLTAPVTLNSAALTSQSLFDCWRRPAPAVKQMG